MAFLKEVMVNLISC